MMASLCGHAPACSAISRECVYQCILLSCASLVAFADLFCYEMQFSTVLQQHAICQVDSCPCLTFLCNPCSAGLTRQAMDPPVAAAAPVPVVQPRSPELRTLQQELADLNASLDQMDKDIYDAETHYIVETPHGNLIKGWEGMLESKPAAQPLKRKAENKERIFTHSSYVFWRQVLKMQKDAREKREAALSGPHSLQHPQMMHQQHQQMPYAMQQQLYGQQQQQQQQQQQHGYPLQQQQQLQLQAQQQYGVGGLGYAGGYGAAVGPGGVTLQQHSSAPVGPAVAQKTKKQTQSGAAKKKKKAKTGYDV
jgi:Histone acetyltransferase subunit NuA4